MMNVLLLRIGRKRFSRLASKALANPPNVPVVQSIISG